MRSNVFLMKKVSVGIKMIIITTYRGMSIGLGLKL